MKIFRALGLTVTAVLVVTAFAAAGSASADALCKENVNPCPKGASYAVGTTFKMEAEELVLTGESFSMKCKTGASEFKTTKDLGAGKGLEISLTSETLKGCEGTCKEVTMENLPYSGTIKATGEGNGTTIETGAKEVGFALTGCTGLETPCQYRLAQRTRTFLGGNPFRLDMTQIFVRTSGAPPCPSKIIEKTRWVGGVLVWIEETFIP
jgi:hypothetical protein